MKVMGLQLAWATLLLSLRCFKHHSNKEIQVIHTPKNGPRNYHMTIARVGVTKAPLLRIISAHEHSSIELPFSLSNCLSMNPNPRTQALISNVPKPWP